MGISIEIHNLCREKWKELEMGGVMYTYKYGFPDGFVGKRLYFFYQGIRGQLNLNLDWCFQTPSWPNVSRLLWFFWSFHPAIETPEYSICSWCQWWTSRPVRIHSLTWRLLMEISCVCSTATSLYTVLPYHTSLYTVLPYHTSLYTVLPYHTSLYTVLPYHMLGFTMNDAQWYGAGGWGRRHDEDQSRASTRVLHYRYFKVSVIWSVQIRVT